MYKPMNIPEDTAKELVGWKAFWMKDEKVYPVVRVGIKENGELVMRGGGQLVGLACFDYTVHTNPNKEEQFHALLPLLSPYYNRDANIDMVKLYMKQLGWWGKEFEMVNERILTAGYVPVVAEVVLRGNLKIDLETNQITGDNLTIVQVEPVPLD